MPLFVNKLRALGYPAWDSFDPNDMKGVFTLVVWLENTKIRHYEQDDRKELSTYSPRWLQKFAPYLQELGCPRPYSSTMGTEELCIAIDWTLGHAIGLEYHETADELNTNAKKMLAENLIKMSKEDAAVLEDPAFRESLTQIAEFLRIPTNTDFSVILQTVAQTIEQRFPEAAKRASSAVDEQPSTASEPVTATATPSEQSQKLASTLDPHAFPLGFSTGDPEVDKAATILRLLYIADLRVLQTQINEIIVAVQEYTANPKTDSTLGKMY